MKRLFLAVVACIIFTAGAVAKSLPDSSLRAKIAEIAKPIKGIVGVSIMNVETGDTLSLNGKARLVMHSVMKVPIALTVLHWVDTGKLALNQMIHVSKRDLHPDTWSPL